MFSSYRSLLKHMRVLEFRDGVNVSVEFSKLKILIRYIIEREPFDEAWYVETYSDVADAIRDGSAKSGRLHYIENGYFEGRLPGLFDFDAEKYVEKNPDLTGMTTAEATKHFVFTGYSEGRPY